MAAATTGCDYLDRKFDVGYGDIAAKQWGEDLSTHAKFLAIHGWVHNAATFDPLIIHFVRQNRCVVSIDLPGNGLSSHHPLGLPYTPASELQAIRSVIKQLGWSCYTIIGHSMGGMRATEYALCWPDEVTSVICIDALLPVLESIPLDYANISEVDPYAAFSEKTDKYLRVLSSSAPRVREYNSWEELKSTWLSTGLNEDNFNILMKRGCKRLENGKYVTSHDLLHHHRVNILMKFPRDILIEKLKRSSFCYLLIRASRGILGGELSANVQSHLDSYRTAMGSRFQVSTIDGTHNLHMEKPDAVCRVMETFLTEVAAGNSKL